MRKKQHLFHFIVVLILVFLFNSRTMRAQTTPDAKEQPRNFWNNVQYGGGVGLNFSSGFTDVFISPSAIYNLNSVVALGGGINLNYVATKNINSSFIYGLSTIVLVNPMPEIQLSIVINPSRIHYKEQGLSNFSENYWDTSFIVGAGYRNGNVTIGIGYNVFRTDRFGGEPFVPFVRAFF